MYIKYILEQQREWTTAFCITLHSLLHVHSFPSSFSGQGTLTHKSWSQSPLKASLNAKPVPSSLSPEPDRPVRAPCNVRPNSPSSSSPLTREYSPPLSKEGWNLYPVMAKNSLIEGEKVTCKSRESTH